MKESLIVKYCDTLLKELDKLPKGGVLKYATGRIADGSPVKVEDDALIRIGMPESYYDICLEKIERLDFIHRYKFGGGRRFIDELNQYVDYGEYELSITDAGRHFITNTSFKKEGRKHVWGRRIPNIIAGGAALVSLAALLVTYLQYKAQTEELSQTKLEMYKRIQDSEGRLYHHVDSLATSYGDRQDTLN